MQISRISHKDAAFPDMLRELKKPPTHINVLGTLPKDNLVAVVGTRKSTPYGEKITYQIASELAKAGAVIVSGLARGIDTIAHQAAIDAGGKTVAVLGTSLHTIYPAQNRGLAKQILATGGALVSEYDEDEETKKWFFADRDRIIAGLCLGVIVTEAGEGSGALITARDAHALSREVMAVPGNITSVASAGTNHLIRTKNAQLIMSPSDVIVALGFHARENAPVPAKSKEEALVLRLLANEVNTSETLIQRSGLSAAQFANVISLMEITGKVRNLGAGQWVAR
jgi:DNA processing protein